MKKSRKIEENREKSRKIEKNFAKKCHRRAKRLEQRMYFGRITCAMLEESKRKNGEEVFEMREKDTSEKLKATHYKIDVEYRRC